MPLPRITSIRQLDTTRLIPTRFADSEDSVLGEIADDDAHLNDLFDLDNATNQRLQGEYGKLPGVGIDELVFGIPHFRIINAAFTYPRPEGSRFNTADRGAWYCAFDKETALAEIAFHKTVEYFEINRFDDCVSYREYLADFSGPFHDLRNDSLFEACLAPDSYIASQSIALELLDAGSLGVIYPCVRRPVGTNLACFRPALVSNVRLGATYELRWSGTPHPAITRIG